METAMAMALVWVLGTGGEAFSLAWPTPQKARRAFEEWAKDPKRHIESFRERFEKDARRRHAHSRVIQ